MNNNVFDMSFGSVQENNGVSPIAKVEQTEDGAVITITDKDGTTNATVKNGKDGKDGKNARGIMDIDYDQDRGLWYVRYTDNTYQYFSGINPLTGKFTYFDDSFLDYGYSKDIETVSPYRYYSETKTAYISNCLVMNAVGSSKNATDSVGVYNGRTSIMGESVIQFDYTPTVSTGKNSPFLEVRLFDNRIWCRINRARLNWFCVSTTSGLDSPSTPTGERLSVNYELDVTYRFKIIVKKGSVTIKSWKAHENEPNTNDTNSISLVSDLIDDQLLSVQYLPVLIFGQINDVSTPNAEYQCIIDNYKIYKE